jgi:hypothetical protein
MTDVVVTLDSVPQVIPMQPTPERDQVTPRFRESFCTVAEKPCVPFPVGVLAVIGETLTKMDGGGTPLAALNAAMAAPQLSVAPSVAFANAAPADDWIRSSTISFVLGAPGTLSFVV